MRPTAGTAMCVKCPIDGPASKWSEGVFLRLTCYTRAGCGLPFSGMGRSMTNGIYWTSDEIHLFRRDSSAVELRRQCLGEAGGRSSPLDSGQIPGTGGGCTRRAAPDRAHQIRSHLQRPHPRAQVPHRRAGFRARNRHAVAGRSRGASVGGSRILRGRARRGQQRSRLLLECGPRQRGRFRRGRRPRGVPVPGHARRNAGHPAQGGLGWRGRLPPETGLCRVKRWTLLVVVLAVAAVAVVWQARAYRQQAARLAQLSAENQRVRGRVADLAHSAAAPAGAPAPAPATEGQSAPSTTKAAINPEDAIAVQRLKLSLAEANTSIARLESRADEAEAQIQNLRLDNKRLAGSEADLKENLAAANQAVDSLQKELKSSRDRVTQVEIAYQKLRDQSGGDAQKIAQLQQLSTELQDIHQRREVYLNSILRRYKQITEQYRSMSGVLQAQRTDAPAAGSADLARIQDSIAMAEEDLRQLNNLNARALLIQKKMAGK